MKCFSVGSHACKQWAVRWIGLLGLLFFGGLASAHAQGLPVSSNLQREIAAAHVKGEPLVVMVSLDQCPFCIVARRSYLVPLLKQGQPIVQVNMRSSEALLGVDGRPTSHHHLAQAWNISVAPTLLFLGPGGVELAERIEGASLPDFYGAYIDERILTSRVKLHTPGSRGNS